MNTIDEYPPLSRKLEAGSMKQGLGANEGRGSSWEQL